MSVERVRFDPTSFGLPAQPALTRTLAGEDATRALGRALAAVVRPGEVLALLGTLGAGKTTLVQGVAAALGLEGAVSSPTYTLINMYARPDTTAQRYARTPSPSALAHIDLYRLESFDDLESIGYWEVVEDEEVVSCVEWLNRIPPAWPEWGRGVARQGMVVWLQRVRAGAARQAQVWCPQERAPAVRAALAGVGEERGAETHEEAERGDGDDGASRHDA